MEKYDIERYLKIRYAHSPSFSPDGAKLAFLTNITGMPQLWSIGVNGGWPEQLTFHEDRVSGISYSPLENKIKAYSTVVEFLNKYL